MTSRTATSVVVMVSRTTHSGETQTTHYGPFLPHVGSAATSFANKLDQELESSGRFAHWDISFESVFIGDDESDCEIRATR